MAIRTAFSENEETEKAASELGALLREHHPRAVLFFASSEHDPSIVARSMQEALSPALTFGCTTAGEIIEGRMLKGSVVALALGEQDIGDIHAVSVQNPGDPAAVRSALEALANRFGGLASLDPATHVGLVLQDGMLGTEETVMNVLSTATNVPFVGGSAGDDGAFERTYTFVSGEAKEGAAVLVLMRPRRPFSILKTQSFDVLDKVLVATDVDEATRTIHAFDGKPASEAYADALGLPASELSANFMTHPLGLVLSSGEPYVRSPQQIRGTDVVFYCSVKSGMRLHVLAARNIVEDTRRDLERALAEMASCSGIINFHCILRTAELEAKNQCDAYGKLFVQYPTIGFSTYGESYIGHINQTSTMLLLG